jgi:hypothetical protein
VILVQITLHLDWSEDGRPIGFVVTSDGSPRRPFSGRLELLAALEALCIPQPTATAES